MDVLMQVAGRNPLRLEEPRPLFIILGYADSGIHVQCCLWTARANFLELRNLIQCEIKEAFAEAGIEIPYPRRALVAGNRTEPLPVRILRGETSQS